MTLLKLTLITLLSTVIYAAQTGDKNYFPNKDELQGKEQKPAGIHYGTILEIKDVMEYKYLKINENGKEIWVAILKVPVAVGDKIGYDKKIVMRDFKSKALDQTFKEIYFSSDVYLSKDNDPFVKKDTYTIEEIHKWRNHLKGQVISIEATVTRVLHEIMELDWVHLGDGTGNAQERTDDLTFTAKGTTIEEGNKVIATGKVEVDKDFGFGYFYRVIIQDATFKVK